VTAIAVGADGRVRRAVLSHRPLDVVGKFVVALSERRAALDRRDRAGIPQLGTGAEDHADD